MTTPASPAPLSERSAIDIRAIERELNALWKQETDQQADQRHSVTRIRVLNLVIVTRGGAESERATETAARLTLRHPHRAIVINAMPHAPGDTLEAWVQAHCTLPAHGRPRVCGEQITIEAHGPALDRVPYTLLPLLVPDVPVMLWWIAGEPFDDPRFAKFGDMINRVVVDSATFDAPEAGLSKMAELLAGGMHISDLSWSRLTPWRELTAQFFDAPAQVAHLAEITGVTIDYEVQASGSDRSQALLLVGWLAARLGWRVATPLLDDGDASSVRLRRPDGGAVLATLRPAAPKDDALDRLAALRLDAPRATFSVARDVVPNCAVARAEVSGIPALERRVRLERQSEADLLGEELRLLGHDQTFAESAAIAAEMLGKGT